MELIVVDLVSQKEYTILFANVDLLNSLIGQKIVEVNRYIFNNDMYLENFEQLADGGNVSQKS